MFPSETERTARARLSSHRTHLQYTQYIYDGTLSIKFNTLASDLHLSCISTLGYCSAHLKSDTSWETTFVLCKVRTRTKHTRIYIPSVTTCYIYVSTFRSLLGTRGWNQCCLIQHPAINPSFVSVDVIEYSLANGLFYLEIRSDVSPDFHYPVLLQLLINWEVMKKQKMARLITFTYDLQPGTL